MLHDRAPDGRLLVTRDDWRVEAVALRPGSSEERDLSWLDVSNVADLTPDGAVVALVDVGVVAGSKVVSYLRGTDGSPAVRLGEGVVLAFAPDGKRVILSAETDRGPALVIVPTGPGKATPLPQSLPLATGPASWFPSGDQLAVVAAAHDEPGRCYVVDLRAGTARPVTPPDQSCGFNAVSPDGRSLLITESDGAVAAVDVDSGERRPLRGLESNEVPLRWSADGKSVLAGSRDGLPMRVTRIDVDGSSRQQLLTLGPRETTGVYGLGNVALTPSASGYAYSYLRHLSTLFLASGVKQR
jgi:eukaryotic-like serine/threonine-protein kinase